MDPIARDASEADFDSLVIDRSAELPVVVDFWAAWCGPCRALGPVIEHEVAAMNGRVELVKVDTDASPALAARYQIRGIPAVKAFRDGRVVAEFVGSQPAPRVREFLQSLLPSQAELESATALAQAIVALEQGRLDDVEPLLARVDERGPLYDRADAVRRLVELFSVARDFGGEEKARAQLTANPADHEARYALASALAARGEVRAALEELLELVTRSRKLRDDGARRAMLVLFDSPAIDPELVREFRRKLQIVT